ncbi:cell wall-binding protein [Methylomonas sp. SURF-2]|uniref:Cell wall-binding protein n=1 Tax=Methylomonas subterranea TaxID=2952225 RepID=A0ABT1TDK7_9GAMM|nr:cell wall-binding protein [Methylomonas sp. SURF-2]MCQ8103541.1 cell wall-binding protein [Methylomonas sp. SURF-2]
MAKKPAGKKAGKAADSGNGGGNWWNFSNAFGDYMIKNGSFYQVKKRESQNGTNVSEFPLCNFVARITEEVIADNDLKDTAFLRIEGRRADGVTLPAVDVPAKSFMSNQGNWPNEAWGMLPFLHPGAAKKDNLRACIQLFSQLKGDIPRCTVYKFTGWKKIDGQWRYLTGTGAISTNGLMNDVQVDMGQGNIGRYQLPAPLQGDELKQAYAAMRLLLDICPGKPAVGATLFAAVARAPLDECKSTDFALWLHGLTGSRKSAVAAIAQSFFGDFHDRSFPANWSDSITDLEFKIHQAKDGIITIDDFKPSTSRAEADKLHGYVERLVRNIGNAAGRGRRTTDCQAIAAPFNRSMVVITGEDTPRSQSIAGRLLMLELNRADVDNATLTKLQQAAAAGLFSGLMASYLQWLAPRLDQLKADFPLVVRQLRDGAIRDGFAASHPRAPELFSNLVAGTETFLDYLLDVDNVTAVESNALLARIEDGLKTALGEQAEYQSERCEVQRFMELLRSVLSSGNGHITTTFEKGPPKTRPYSWGWRDAGNDLIGEKQFKPCGNCIGWHRQGTEDKPDEVWLDPNAAFSAVQSLAKSQGDAFLLSSSALWRRMSDMKLLLAEERDRNGKPRTQVKRAVNGPQCTRRVIVLAAELIESGS